MSDLGPDARDLIGQARREGAQLLGPTSADRARVRAKLAPLWDAETAERAKPPLRSGRRYGGLAAVVITGLGLLGYGMLRQATPQTPVGQAAQTAQTGRGREARRALPSSRGAPSPSAPGAQGSPDRRQPPAPLEGPRAPGDLPPIAAAAPAAQGSRAVARVPTASGARAEGHGPLPPSPLSPSSVAKAPRPRDPRSGSRDEPEPNVTAGHARPERPRTATRPSQTQSEPRAPGPRRAGFDEREPRASAATEPSSADLPSVATRRAAAAPARVEPDPPPNVDEPDRPSRVARTRDRPAPPSIDGELELLGSAQAALRERRPSRALKFLQEHAFRFPTGALVDERLVMQALALCAMQRRRTAETVLARLAARGSQSPLLPRVRKQCGL